MRLIDADAFIKENQEIIDCEIDHPKYQDTLRELINNAPTLPNPCGKPCAFERPHGEWMKSDIPESLLAKCSICGFDCGAYTHNFCPNCGADMRQKTCGNCYWFSKVTVPCCEQDKEPTTENEKACDRWEEGESE